MNTSFDSVRSRRALLKSAFTVAGGALVASCTRTTPTLITAAPAAPPAPPPHIPAAVATRPAAPAGVRPELFERAVAALDRHSMRIPSHDKIAIVDFAKASHERRMHVINMGTNEVESVFVSHGSGSDPDHTGWLQRFSNVEGSNATSEGAYVTAEYYVGQHDLSQRLDGLDPTNDNARQRAIVVHGAWYANQDMIAQHGKLGRSQGCFAVGETVLQSVFDRLGQGRMIYAAKV